MSRHLALETPDRDPFASAGEKYRFLLQLQDGARVALAGDEWEGLAEDFSRAGLQTLVLGRASSPPSLAVDAAFLDRSRGGDVPWIEALPALLSPAGVGVVLNRYRMTPASIAEARVRTGLVRAGLTSVRAFTPVPRLGAVEAFVTDPDAGREWDLVRTWAQRARRDLGLPERQRVYFAGRSSRPDGFAVVEGAITELMTGASARAERYHLRRRGALVVVLRSDSGTRVVARVATNSDIAELVRRNHRCTDRLRRIPNLAPHVLALIPAPIGALARGGADVFAEEFRPGRLAWTAYRDREVAHRVDADLLRFTLELQRATRHQAAFDEGQFLADWIEPIRDRAGGHPDVIQALDSIAASAARLLRGRLLPRAQGHGDFGIGNALVGPEGGVSGVIDWDQQVASDLPGVDWCDHLLKASHVAEGVSARLRSLVAESLQSGWIAPAGPGFGRDDFGLTRAELRLVPCLGALRDVARSARFPSELRDVNARVAVLGTVAELLASE